MRRGVAAFCTVVGMLLPAGTAGAEQLVTSLSTHRVLIASNFTGQQLVLFGAIERDAATVSRGAGYDVVVTVTGPRQNLVTRRKSRMLGIWFNSESRSFVDAPTYLSVLASRPVAEIVDPAMARRYLIGLSQTAFAQGPAGQAADTPSEDPFRAAFIRLNVEHGYYSELGNAVTFLTPNLFRASIWLPADAPIGTYEVEVKLFAGGVLLARTSSAFESVKVGFEQFIANAAREHGFLYGLATALMALATGWLASVVFRRD